MQVAANGELGEALGVRKKYVKNAV